MALFADTGHVLELCLDTSLTPEERTEILVRDGWTEGSDPIEAVATALTLTRLNSGQPEGWSAVRDKARLDAPKAEAGDVFLTAPNRSDAVFIGRNWSGLQTCLYLGSRLETDALADVLDGSILRTIGEVTRIRGDGPKSLISAHGMTEAGRDVFAPRLAYAMTFTVVLDRQAGDPR